MSKQTPKRLTLDTAVPVAFAASEETKPRKFQMTAYTGAAVDGWFGKLIIDVAGLQIGSQKKPILRQHDPNQIAGFSEVITKDGAVTISGTLSSRTDAGREVAELADEGFPWQASVGIAIQQFKQLSEQESMSVNGQDITGPAMVITKSQLKESSFVPLGADGATSGVVLSDETGQTINPPEFINMNLEQFKQFASEHPEALAPYIDQAKRQGATETRAEFGKFAEAFPAHAQWAGEQFIKGRTLDEAKSLRAEIDKATAEKDAALKAEQEKNAKLAAQIGTQGAIATKPTGEDEKPADKYAGLSLKDKTAAMWKDDHEGCQKKYRSLAVFSAYMNSIEPKQTKQD